MCAQGTVTLGADTPKGQHWLWRLQGKCSVGTYTQEYMEGITSATAYFSNKTETWDLSEIWHNVAKITSIPRLELCRKQLKSVWEENTHNK